MGECARRVGEVCYAGRDLYQYSKDFAGYCNGWYARSYLYQCSKNFKVIVGWAYLPNKCYAIITLVLPLIRLTATFSQWEKGENISCRGFNKKTLYPIAKNKNIYYNDNIDNKRSGSMNIKKYEVRGGGTLKA